MKICIKIGRKLKIHGVGCLIYTFLYFLFTKYLDLKSRLRGDSGRQYIQRYESSKKDIDQLNDEGFFASIEKLETRMCNFFNIFCYLTKFIALVDDETKNSNTHDKKSQPTILSKDDQDFLDELI